MFISLSLYMYCVDVRLYSTSEQRRENKVHLTNSKQTNSKIPMFTITSHESLLWILTLLEL